MTRAAAVAVLLALTAPTPALAVPPPDDPGPCPYASLDPNVLTPDGAKISAGGGVVVTTMQGNTQTPPTGDPSVQPSWRWQVEGMLVVPSHTTVAPGLTIYPVPHDATLAALVDLAHSSGVTVTVVASAGKALATPKLVHARTGTKQVTAELGAALPAGAIALIGYVGGTARAWGMVDASSGKAIVVWHDPVRCEVVAPGTTEIRKGDKLTVAWVDASGRVSPQSAAVAVDP